jgi:integrase/recombinase XerD
MGFRKVRKNAAASYSVVENYSDYKELTLGGLHEIFLRYKKSEGLSTRTINDYKAHFSYLTKFLGGDLSYEDIKEEIFIEYKNNMLHDSKYSLHTVNLRVRTLRAFLKFCFDEGYISIPIHNKIKIVRVPLDNVAPLEPEEIKLILNVIDDEWYVGFRDKVIIITLLDTMTRINELLAAKRKHVDLINGTIYLEANTVKTRQGRAVPLSLKVTKLIREYMNETKHFQSEYLFLTSTGTPLKDNTFRKKLMEYGKLAGIEKQVSPHVLRHTGALMYVLAGGDVFSLQKILGHSDLTMTRRYVQMAASNVKDKHDLFSPLKNILN